LSASCFRACPPGRIVVRAIARLPLLVCPGVIAIVIIATSGIASAGVIVGSGERTFVIPESFPTAVAKLQTVESHRRLFASLRIAMREIEREKLSFQLRTGSIDAELHVVGHAPRISRNEFNVREVIHLERNDVRIEFSLMEPAGMLLEHVSIIEATGQGTETKIRLRLDTRVATPCRRSRLVNRMIARVGRRRVNEEVCGALWRMQQEILSITSDDLPPDSESVLGK